MHGFHFFGLTKTIIWMEKANPISDLNIPWFLVERQFLATKGVFGLVGHICITPDVQNPTCLVSCAAFST
jgi:hypothetical protein